MIQDIAPRHLDNQYRNITPDAKDTIFFFARKYSFGITKR